MSNNFWNNWGIKDVIQIILIILGFIISFVKLDSRVDSNKEVFEVKINEVVKTVDKIENNITRLTNYLLIKNKSE